MSITIGNGSRDNPFVITIPVNMPSSIGGLNKSALALLYSTRIQNVTIDDLYGKGEWTASGRDYLESPLGSKGNGDLCRWSINANGQEVSVWFDLSNVSYVLGGLGGNPPENEIF